MCKKSANFRIALFRSLKRTIAHFQNMQLPNPACWAMVHLLIAHFRSFQKCNCGIALLLLFSKELLCNRTFCCSFQKCNCAITLLSLFSKVRLCDRTFCCSFLKVRQKERSHNCSLEKSECAKLCEKCANFLIALFSLFKKRDRTFSKHAIAQPYFSVT